jgi:hypothetical protein
MKQRKIDKYEAMMRALLNCIMVTPKTRGGSVFETRRLLTEDEAMRARL